MWWGKVKGQQHQFAQALFCRFTADFIRQWRPVRERQRRVMIAKVTTAAGATVKLKVFSNQQKLFWCQFVQRRTGRRFYRRRRRRRLRLTGHWNAFKTVQMHMIDQYLDFCLVKWITRKGPSLWGLANKSNGIVYCSGPPSILQKTINRLFLNYLIQQFGKLYYLLKS